MPTHRSFPLERSLLIVSVALACLFAKCHALHPKEPTPASGHVAVRGQIVVRLRPEIQGCLHCAFLQHRSFATVTGTSVLDSLMSQYPLEEIVPLFGGVHTKKGHRSAAGARGRLDQIYLLRLAADADTDSETIADSFRRDPSVASAEPDYVYRATNQREAVTEFEPNDPFFSSLGSWGQEFQDMWGLLRIRADKAWQVSKGAGVVVAVVDSGVDGTHPDLAGNVVAGRDFTRCVRLDGYGVCLDPKEPGTDTSDHLGHGTHIAGTIAAVGNNGIGIVGVAPEAIILPIKGLSDLGFGASSDLAEAIVYAVDNGARIINASWSGDAGDIIAQAIEYATAAGVTVVAAAGNESAPLDRGSFPATLPDVIAVGATTFEDRPASFSNFGAGLSLMAPGGGDSGTDELSERSILSTLAAESSWAKECRFRCLPPGSEDCELVQTCHRARAVIGEQYVRAAGTSMAAPHVSGVAALILSAHPSYDANQIKQVLMQTADDLGAPGWDPVYGYGRVNAERAVSQSSVTVAQISSPGNRVKIHPWMFPLTVRGRVAGGTEGLKSWRLSLRSASGSIAELGSGTGSVTDGTLGIIEEGQVEPGVGYTLMLEAENHSGHASFDTKTLLRPALDFVPVPLRNSVFTGGFNQSLSADGTRHVFTRTKVEGREYAYLFDTRTQTLTTFGSMGSINGPISPDGRTVAYSGYLPDGSTCDSSGSWLMKSILFDVQSETYQCIGDGWRLEALDLHASRVAFTSNLASGGGPFQLFLHDVSSGQSRAVTSLPPRPFGSSNAGVGNVAMNYDGRRVVFDAMVPLDPPTGFPEEEARQVFAYDDATGLIRQVSGRGSALSGGSPAISGDGKRIVYTSGDPAGLFLNEFGSNDSELLISDASACCARITSDGSAVAFVAAMDVDPTVGNEDLNPEIFVLDLATRKIRQVTDTVFAWRESLELAAMDGNAQTFAIGDWVQPSDMSRSLVLSSGRLVRRRPGNSAPVLSVPESVHTLIRKSVRIELSATDAENDPITFFVQPVPIGRGKGLQFIGQGQLEDAGDGTAVVSLQPLIGDAGDYTLRVAAFDDAGGVALADIALQIDIPTPTFSRRPTVSPTPSRQPTLSPTHTSERPTLTPSPSHTAIATNTRSSTPTVASTHTPPPVATSTVTSASTATSTAHVAVTVTATAVISPTATPVAAQIGSGCAAVPADGPCGWWLLLAPLLIKRQSGRRSDCGRHSVSV